MMRVITIEREYGSGGGEIAEKLAARLGWKLWDQVLTQEIAKRMDCECNMVAKHEEREDPAAPAEEWAVDGGPATVGIDGPEHSADHAEVAPGRDQLVLRSHGCLAGDEIVHRLTDDQGRCV